MQKNGAKLTVFFEEPFWVGLYQRWSGPKPGTKSQQALALQREAAKASRQEDARQRKERERQEKFQIRQRKRKEKHRGR